MKKKEYLIGDVAAMIGVSRDTLRLYEKKGIISIRKKENGYRYYTDEDIFALSSIFYHRNMNLGLGEIENLWSGNISYQTNAVTAEQKIQEEEARIRKHQESLVRLRLFQDECRKIDQHLNRFSILPFRDAYLIETCASPQEGIMRWFFLAQKAPGLDTIYTYNTYRYDAEPDDGELVFEHSSLLFYKELAKDFPDSLDYEAYPSTEVRNCVYTIVESASRIPDKQLIGQMMDWGRRQGYHPDGTVISDYIMHGMKDGSFTYYLEIYVPVS